MLHNGYENAPNNSKRGFDDKECSRCKQRFPSQQQLYSHIITHHTESKSANTSFNNSFFQSPLPLTFTSPLGRNVDVNNQTSSDDLDLSSIPLVPLTDPHHLSSIPIEPISELSSDPPPQHEEFVYKPFKSTTNELLLQYVKSVDDKLDQILQILASSTSKSNIIDIWAKEQQQNHSF